MVRPSMHVPENMPPKFSHDPIEDKLQNALGWCA